KTRSRDPALRQLRLSETWPAVFVVAGLACPSPKLSWPFPRNLSRTFCQWPTLEERVLGSPIAKKDRSRRCALGRCATGQQRIDAAKSGETCARSRRHCSSGSSRLWRTEDRTRTN